MINSKKELNEWLSYERKQYGCPSGIRGLLRYLVGNENAVIWHFQRRMRITEYYFNTNKRFLYFQSLFRFNHLRNKYSLIFYLNTCGKGLKIMHLGPILTNRNAQIGENCALHINTSIVAQGISNAAPILGNGVVVGVGAVILGGVKIADNVAIGANAVVNHDVDEENIAVAGVHAQKISNNGRLEWNKHPT
jgi:serine O-acetyltransferase